MDEILNLIESVSEGFPSYFFLYFDILWCFISQLIRFARVSSQGDNFYTRNKFLTAKLLRQGYRSHKIHKAFSKFYRRHFDI